MRRVVAASLMLACLAARASGDTLDAVRERANAGHFAQAHALLELEPDPLLRARAEVWLLYRARHVDEALAAAELGLEIAPSDLWLSERAWSASAWNRDVGRMVANLARFERTMDGAEPALRAPFEAARASAREATAQQVELSRRVDVARRRATVVVGIAGALCVVVLLALARVRHPFD